MKRNKRAGVVKPATKGLRTCVGCGIKLSPEQLLRFVLDPNGRLFVDRYQKAPGRGVYMCYDANCLVRALKSKGFERGFKTSVQGLDESLVRAAIVESLEARVEDMLSIARVAKQTVSGMDSLNRSLGRLQGVVVAEDIALATRSKIEQWSRSRDFGLVEYGTAGLLGRTQGKAHRVAVGVCEPRLWQRLVKEVERRKRVLVAGSNGKS